MTVYPHTQEEARLIINGLIRLGFDLVSRKGQYSITVKSGSAAITVAMDPGWLVHGWSF